LDIDRASPASATHVIHLRETQGPIPGFAVCTRLVPGGRSLGEIPSGNPTHCRSDQFYLWGLLFHPPGNSAENDFVSLAEPVSEVPLSLHRDATIRVSPFVDVGKVEVPVLRGLEGATALGGAFAVLAPKVALSGFEPGLFAVGPLAPCCAC
jgi:hypothetical protein